MGAGYQVLGKLPVYGVWRFGVGLLWYWSFDSARLCRPLLHKGADGRLPRGVLIVPVRPVRGLSRLLLLLLLLLLLHLSIHPCDGHCVGATYLSSYGRHGRMPAVSWW
jgi:hypothetical protein